MSADDRIEWRVTPGLFPCPEILAEMEARASAIRAGEASELIRRLEHPLHYTVGTSADPPNRVLGPDGCRS